MNEHQEFSVTIPIGDDILEGILTIPQQATGLVLFAHGSGSSRFSPRNQFVASMLNQGTIATLLIDLFTPEEEKLDNLTRELRFDIDFLAKRLIQTTDWIEKDPKTKHLALGYFGSSTGAAAALIAAAKEKHRIKTVVSRGGRPDLAHAYLPKIVCPVLLIVGGADYGVIELNQQAYDLLNCPKKMIIVPHATHLFEEEGTLEEVARHARDWFNSHLS